MTEQDNAAHGKQGDGERRFVRGKFPQLSLTEALKLPKAVYELGQGDRVRRVIAFDQLKRSPDSGPSRTLVTASTTSYGLTEGGTKASHLKLTDRGRQLVGPVSQTEKLQAAHEAFFSNEIFAGFIDYYEDKPFPRDDMAVDFLVTEHNLPEKSAQSMLSVIRDNVNDFGLTQFASGRTLIASRETASQNLGDTPVTQRKDEAERKDEASVEGETPTPDGTGEGVQEGPSAREILNLGTGGQVTPQIHFNVQIQIPENGSPEEYDAIFKSIGTYLLGRKDEQ